VPPSQPTYLLTQPRKP